MSVSQIADAESEFLSGERDPPRLDGVPATAAALLWTERLERRVAGPVRKIAGSHAEVRSRFRKLERLLKEFRKEKFESWKSSANEKLGRFLQTNLLLKRTPDSTTASPSADPQSALSYEVIFPLLLEEVSTEAKILEYLGYEIPSSVKSVILQERTFHRQRDELTTVLQELRNSLSSLRREEVSVLRMPAEELSTVLDPGAFQVCWESTDTADFLVRAKQAVDLFRGVVHRTKNITSETDSRIELLKNCDLFEFDDVEQPVQSCEMFFGNAELKMERKIQRMVEIYRSLPALLRKLEVICAKTSTGRSEALREYYGACEESVLAALTQLLLSNLEFFREETLRHRVFPFVAAAVRSEDELVASSVARLELVFLAFLKGALESTRRLPRWLDGTCIESQSFRGPDRHRLEISFHLDLSLHPGLKALALGILADFCACVNREGKSGQSASRIPDL